jgi:hypothetical protein
MIRILAMGIPPEIQFPEHEQAACVVAGKRVLKIGGGCKRFDARIGKLFGKHPAEPRAELLPANALRGTHRVGAQELETARLGAAESLDFQNDSLGRALCDAQDPPRQIALFGPEVDKRLFARAPDFEAQTGEFGQPLPVLVYFHASGSRQFIQRAPKLD